MSKPEFDFDVKVRNTNAATDQDRDAAMLQVTAWNEDAEQQNSQDPPPDPLIEILPTTPDSQLYKSYETVLSEKVVKVAHASYANQTAALKAAEADIADRWARATDAEKQAASDALPQ